MILTAASLYHYLRDRHLVAPEDIVNSDFRIENLSRRNRSFQVVFDERPGWVVKQVKDWKPVNISTFETEAHWYWLARHDDRFAPMSRFLSGCRGYDAENQILILDVPRGSADLARHQAKLGRFPVETAELLGDTLAAFHTALDADAMTAMRAGFRDTLPWVFSFHQTNPKSLEESAPAAFELLRIVRDQPEFGRAFERCQAAWKPSTLINGDMKFAHCIRATDPQPLYFVDWEMAVFGDPCWDTGAILQEYLHAWVNSIPAAPGAGIEDVIGKARQPLDEVRPAMSAFWNSYIRRAGLDAAEADARAGRSALYAAAWLIQTARQSLEERRRINTRAIRLAQLSLNMIRSGSEGLRLLLGI